MTSSSKPLSAANIYSGNAAGAGQYTYTVGQGITAGQGIGSIGNVTISADEIKALTGNVVGTSPTMILSVESSEPKVAFYESDGNQRIKAVFEPDGGMSVSELAKVIKLMMVIRESSMASSCAPISFIRRHNLERHFRFSTV